ncbi:hypothetical protein LOC68_04480 [Blastopirellula sp. JC732]|uniref:Uncharacterized protein n=1 Tax=Blastopirellula sediminis TaxID=2894196 RepID=A0A9X1MIT8_9BACT|nr:DUF4974 domain-containing protein [Blastopirellula sediminis]MCC9609585.1 hypothetical protein [Blastopirellula sediminis]MCC9627639.1 hypothetical protein [Blastopirellula sediminis]
MSRLLLLLTLAASMLGCQPAHAEKPPVTLAENYLQSSDQTAEQDAKVRQQLAAAARIDVVDTPLKDVAQLLSKTYGVDIQLYHRSLEDVGLSPDVPITLSMEKVSLRSILRQMLRELELTYVVEAGRLLILTPEAAEANLTAVYYPCPELIYYDGPEYNSEVQPDYDSLINVITSTIEPEAWTEVGGPAPVYPLENGLVLEQMEEVHAKIAALLDALRTAKSLPNAGYDPTPINVSPDGDERLPELRASLDKRGTRSFQDVPLVEFAAYLHQLTGSSVLINRRSLEDVGVSPDLPITCDLGDASARDLLQYLTREYELTYVLENESIVITTPEDAESALLVKVYPVRDLVAKREKKPARQRWPYFGNNLVEGYSFEWKEPDYDSLITAISAGVDPDSWENIGGPASIMQLENADALVISQTVQTHEKVAQLLQNVRRNRKPRPASTPEAEAKLNEPVLLRYPIPLEDPSEFEINAVAELLRSEVSPASWNDPDYFLKTVGKKDLFIKQTPEMHAKIREWLNQIYPKSGYANPSQQTPGTVGGFGGGFGGGGMGGGGGFEGAGGGFGGGGFGGGGGGFFQVDDAASKKAE